MYPQGHSGDIYLCYYAQEALNAFGIAVETIQTHGPTSQCLQLRTETKLWRESLIHGNGVN